MTPHETVAGLLALSAAGLLDPAEERVVREHVRECPACAARLESLGSLTSALSALPAPAPPADLALRTQALVAAEMSAAAGQREGALLAVGGAALGWISWLGLGEVYRILSGAWPGVWVWLSVFVAMGLMAAPVAAALHKFHRVERRMI